jgi:fermentation-respiration switch protein FrsA (DUF1100 family)
MLSQRARARVASVSLLAVAVVILAVAADTRRDENVLVWLERSLLFRPTFAVVHPTSAFGPGAEEVRFGDDDRLHGIFVPGPRRAPDALPPTLIFFHGNGGNLSHRGPLIARMRADLGVNVFIFDYQGYGQSRGRPSEQATAADARAALSYLHSRPDVDPARIVYYGESLGGAVAISLAAESPPAGMVIQSSFTSIADMTRRLYPALGFLLPFASMRYDSLRTISNLSVPLLFVHGGADTLVPPEHGQRLFDAANEPKRLLVVPSANHNDIFIHGGAGLWHELRAFLSTLHAPAG